MSAPVVLGTLVSKPVLGQVPRNCTVSGQVSGNVSSPGMGDCSQLGYTPEYWIGRSDWTGTGLTKGDVPNNNCAFGGGQNAAGTRFNPTFEQAFRYVGTGSGNTQACTVYAYDEPGYSATTGNTADDATMLQVLRLSTTTSFDGKRLGRAAVASLLNALLFASSGEYPLRPAQVVKMFNQVRQTGFFRVNATVEWGREDVTQYFESINGRSG
jgi:hypothetical protein